MAVRQFLSLTTSLVSFIVKKATLDVTANQLIRLYNIMFIRAAEAHGRSPPHANFIHDTEIDWEFSLHIHLLSDSLYKL